MKLFVYGTLNDSKFLESLLGRSIKLMEDYLFGFCQDFVFVDGESYPNIYKCSGGIIEGRLISNLTDSDLLKLDLYEGPKYRRILVTLESGNKSYVYISD